MTAIFTTGAYLGLGVFSHTLDLVLLFAFLSMLVDGFLRRISKVPSNSNLLIDWSYAVFGAIYCGAFLAHVLLIRDLPGGSALLLLVVLGAAACDSGAYVIGKNIGKRPFFRRISPKKTLEGAIGGFVSCLVVIMACVSLLHVELNTLSTLAYGSILAIAVIFGDLLESVFKRQAGVKDSGSWIPEQGGVLDVIDGFLVAVVFSYYFFFFTMQ